MTACSLPVLAVRLTPEMRSALRREAEKTGNTQAWVIRQALNKYLGMAGKNPVQGRPRWRYGAQAAKRGASD
jgi:hypothetical protein